MALPDRVRLKKYHSTTTTMAVTPSTHRLWGIRVAPRIWIGSSPEKAGRLWVPLPKITAVRPRITREAPMVMMIRVTVSAPFTGSMASFSISTPTTAGTRMASTRAAGRGRPDCTKNTASMPPSMMNSPWAKLITLLAL